MRDVVIWFIAVELLGVAALPLVGAAFVHLPDRGWALAKPLALLLVGGAIWLPLMLFPALPYSRGFIVLIVLLFVAGNVTAVVMHPAIGERWLAWLRAHWRYAAICEALFAAGMGVMADLRTLNPQAEGTEKFMDQAFLSAIMRATHLPPPDPWLAGHSINYYYFGHFLLANIAKLLDTPSPVAFNLGIALTAGLAAIAFFGVAANMTATVLAARRRAHAPVVVDATLSFGERAAPQLNRAIPFALFAVVAALVVGNLRSVAVWWGDMGHTAATQHQPIITVALHWLTHPNLWTTYDYWAPTRAIPNTITEFPSFSFLLADLHAHLLALPYAIMAVGVALHLWLSPPRRGWAVFGEGWGALPTLLASGLTIGALYLINGWDLPTYLALALVALAAHQWQAHGRILSADFFLGLAQAAGVLLVICFIPYLPFYLTFVSPSQGIGIVPGTLNHTAIPLSAGSIEAGLHPESRTAIADEIGANGLMLFVFGTWLAVLLARRLAGALQSVPLGGRPQAAGPTLHTEHPRGAAPNESYLALRMGRADVALATTSVHTDSGGPTTTIDIITGDIAPPPDLPIVITEPPTYEATTPAAPPDLRPAAWRQSWLLIGITLVALGGLTWRFSAWDGWTFIWGVLFMVGALWLALEPLLPRGIADAESTANGFPLLLVAFGAGLIALCEIVFLRDVFVGSAPRMNTVFKSYFQVWTLFALASAPALAWLTLRLPERLPGTRSLMGQPLAWLGRGLWALALVALVAVSLIYPLGASHTLYPVGQSVATTSLNGLTDNAYLDPGDITAIGWLSAHAAPDSVLVEALDPYHSDYINSYGQVSIYGRVSVFTGIPTILGWDGHEYQWRVHWLDNPQNLADYNARFSDLHTIYTSHDPTLVLALLHHYHVRYVYVGSVEQQLYAGPGIDLTHFGAYLTTIYQANGVTIYQVPGV